MISTFSRAWINRVWFANPACDHLNWETIFFRCPRSCLKIWSRETGSAVPSRVSPLILHAQDESDWLVLTRGISPAFRYFMASVPSLLGHAIACTQWRSLSRVRRHRASNPRGSSSKGCCPFRFHHGLHYDRYKYARKPGSFTVDILVR